MDRLHYLLAGIVTCALAYLTRLWIRRARRMAQLNRLPTLPDGHPLLGHVMLFTLPDTPITESMYTCAQELAKPYIAGGIVRFDIGPRPTVWLLNARTAEVLLTSSQNLTKPPEYDYFKDWWHEGLITSTGDKWRARRKLISPAFHSPQLLRTFMPLFNEQSVVLCNKLAVLASESPQVAGIDIRDHITAFTLDVIAETAMGVRMNSQLHSSSEYSNAFTTFAELLIVRNYRLLYWWTPLFRLMPTGRRYFSAIGTLHRYSKRVIDDRKREILSDLEKNNNNTEQPSHRRKRRLALMDLLLEEHIKDEREFTLGDVQEEVDTFMSAGNETTASAIMWTLFAIGHYPEIQAKIREEQVSIFSDVTADQDNPLIPATVDDLNRMQYLEQCIKETLRLYPTVPYIGRVTSESLVIDGHTVPRDTPLLLAIDIIHRDPAVWPDPHTFDPERFTPEQCAARSPFAFIPFSAGPRSCVGQRFAMLEEKTVLSHIFRRFAIKTLTPLDGARKSSEIVLRPNSPIMIQFVSQ